MAKCVFLDRDGVLNKERGDYTYRVEDFEIPDGVIPALKAIKDEGYLLVVITNQAGISRGLYSREEMHNCHQFFQQQSGNLIDRFYYAPYHPTVSESLTRKPNSLLFERATAKFGIDAAQSWMVGDKERDLIPANKLGIKTILLGSDQQIERANNCRDFSEIERLILQDRA